MAEVEFHLHNEVGIKFKPLLPAYSDGDLYFGRFRGLVARSTGTSSIGEGGTGRIHLVRDELMEREVALKIPLDSILRDPAAREDVIQETRQAMDLTHPNIVRIHDFHEGGGKWGISMQYVRGMNLDEWRYHNETGGFRRAIRPYTVDAIRDWVAQLCDALRYAHEDARMVHRDIKPKNLMLEKRDGGEKIYITDFGISQRLRQHTMMLSRDQSKAGESKGNMGTLPYMPWEQISGGPASPLDDIYAVGATIYELITGRPPFYDGGFEQIKVQIREVPPPTMAQRMMDLGLHMPPPPDEWEAIVAACLAKQPEDRPQSMRAVGAALGFQSGSNTELESLITTQAERIEELETRIITINQATTSIVDSGSPDQLARLEESVARSRRELEELTGRLKSAEAERDAALLGGDQALGAFQKDAAKRIAAAEDKVALLMQQLDAAQAGGAEAVNQARQADAQRIADLENALQGTRKESEQAIAKATESLRREADQLTEKLGKAEQSKEKSLSQVREEADKRLQKQVEELEKARQSVNRLVEQNETLQRSVATEKERQGASLKPVLISLLVAAVLGLGGGYLTSRLGSHEPSEALSPNLVGNLPPLGEDRPVKFELFERFANDIGERVEKLGATAADGTVQEVSGFTAMNFCNWLTKKEEKQLSDGSHYTLPLLVDLKDKVSENKLEWSRQWAEGAQGQILIMSDGKAGGDSPVHASNAQPSFTFRIKRDKISASEPK